MTIPISAANQPNHTLSEEEFFSVLNDAYLEKGWVLEVEIPEDEEIVYTTQLLEEELQRVYQLSPSNSEVASIPPMYYPAPVEHECFPYVMPVNFEYGKLHGVNPPSPFSATGVAYFEVFFAGRLDAQNGVIIAVDTCDVVYHAGIAVDSYDLDVDYSITTNNRIKYTVTGSVIFDWSVIGIPASLANNSVHWEWEFSPDDGEIS